MKLLLVLLIILISFSVFSCGKKNDETSPVEETEVVDQVDHTSEVPNDPVFQRQN